MPDSLLSNTVKVPLDPWKRFEEYLRNRGKRITHQRRMLVDHVFEAHDHFDAEDLLAQIGSLEEGRNIGRATIYRTLNELVNAGLLRRMVISGRAVYEHDYGYPQHDHLHCTVCNRLIEFCNTDLVALRDTVAKEHSFRPTGHRFIILGYCGECQSKETEP